jgi:hypothetical protein
MGRLPLAKIGRSKLVFVRDGYELEPRAFRKLMHGSIRLKVFSLLMGLY